jgi:hypothetical protein
MFVDDVEFDHDRHDKKLDHVWSYNRKEIIYKLSFANLRLKPS